MMSRPPLWLPTVARHVTMTFLRTFGIALTGFVAVYILAEFFDRFDTFLRNDVPAMTIVRAFALKVPLIITQVTPLAVLAGSLVGLGTLARHSEFIALRACGVGVPHVALPLLGSALAITVLVFVWNETVVPITSQRWHAVWNTEVRHRKPGSAFRGREVWFRGALGFYDIKRVAPRRRMLYGVTIYELDGAFRPTRIIEAASAHWRTDGWVLDSPRVRGLDPADTPRPLGNPEDQIVLPESLEDFSLIAGEADEYSFGMLRAHIDDLRSKGIDASEVLVDLHLKIALPLASVLMMCIGLPLGARGTRATSLPAAAALGFVLGFGYFVIMGFARALGQSGAVPPLIAAWLANGVYASVGAYLTIGAD